MIKNKETAELTLEAITKTINLIKKQTKRDEYDRRGVVVSIAGWIQIKEAVEILQEKAKAYDELEKEIKNSKIEEMSDSVNTGHHIYHYFHKYYLVRVDKIREILKK